MVILNAPIFFALAIEAFFDVELFVALFLVAFLGPMLLSVTRRIYKTQASDRYQSFAMVVWAVHSSRMHLWEDTAT